jgi:hypothetical protein
MRYLLRNHWSLLTRKQQRRIWEAFCTWRHAPIGMRVLPVKNGEALFDLFDQAGYYHAEILAPLVATETHDDDMIVKVCLGLR